MFDNKVVPNWQDFIACIKREKCPDRVHYIELFLDNEVKDAIAKRFHLLDDVSSDAPFWHLIREMRVNRFLGYDYVRQGIDNIPMVMNSTSVDDTAILAKSTGSNYVNESAGPITNWDEFEKYPWPNVEKFTTLNLEWYSKNRPDDMCIIGSGGLGHYFEWMSFLMGYETLCYALYEDRKLVQAIVDKTREITLASMDKILQFDKVKVIWGSDDLGFRTGPLIGPADLREFVFPGHRELAEISHGAGRPYLLHSCGKLDSIMDELIDDVKIDGKHSFEDVIESITDCKKHYGDKISVLGGVDVDFLCRASEDEIRTRVRNIVEICQPGGGFCLGTGNSVANYIPVDNYLVMLDEGRKCYP